MIFKNIHERVLDLYHLQLNQNTVPQMVEQARDLEIRSYNPGNNFLFKSEINFYINHFKNYISLQSSTKVLSFTEDWM